jgi:signal transduction histidine kinase
VREEVLNYTKSGFPFWADLMIFPIANESGWFTHWVSIQRDITERKQVALKLIKAKETAEAASRAKSQFIGNMSHEIRTPMFGVLGMAEMLAGPDLTEKTRIEYAQIILRSGNILMNLLNDILDMSKIDAGRVTLEFKEMVPSSIIYDVQTLFSANIHKKGLKIESVWTGPKGSYLSDSHRLTQMLSNLVGNALKFTQKGSIRIEAREVTHSELNALLEFSVTDTGIGIAADKQTLLFQPFTQVDSSDTRNHDGAGLGLSIVRKLAELMGGEAGVESEVGKGSRFWFRVQVKRVSKI